MKKFYLLALLFAFSTSVFAQVAKENVPESSSKTVEFMKKDGTLIQRDFYSLGKVKGVECDVLVLTDLVSKEKIGCLRLKTTYSSSYTSDSYIGTLDADELDACIKSLNYINENVLQTRPTNYVEVEYRTRDKVEIGAYYSKKWSAYVKTKSYSSRSIEFFASSELAQLAEIMVQAKALIVEKTR